MKVSGSGNEFQICELQCSLVGPLWLGICISTLSVPWRNDGQLYPFLPRQGLMALSVDEITAIERNLYLNRLNYVLNTFPVAILYYDYALTLSREVEYFWPNPYRTGWVSSVFFLNRYFAILGHIPIIIGLIPNESCEPQNAWQKHHYKGYFGMALQLLVAVLCSMRIYALYNKNNRILLALAALIGASIIVGFIAIATESGVVVIRVPPPIMPICHLSLELSDEGGNFLSIAWGGFLAFDVTVFVLTLYKAVKMGYSAPLIQILVRDGSLYFVVLFFVNLANILTLQFAPTLLKNSATPLTNVLSATLISRLMLRLRSDRIQHGHHSLGTVQTMDSRFTSSLSELSSFWFPTNTHSAAESFEMGSPSGRIVWREVENGQRRIIDAYGQFSHTVDIL
ncbi:hypothetical protein H4582DRAFT_2125947 [Lactarius indigo]|nr:hypothetical protein H4582DRAFT_2125947 [Lactarius indigo]